jgi:hypothetical protein
VVALVEDLADAPAVVEPLWQPAAAQSNTSAGAVAMSARQRHPERFMAANASRAGRRRAAERRISGRPWRFP